MSVRVGEVRREDLKSSFWSLTLMLTTGAVARFPATQSIEPTAFVWQWQPLHLLRRGFNDYTSHDCLRISCLLWVIRSIKSVAAADARQPSHAPFSTAFCMYLLVQGAWNSVACSTNAFICPTSVFSGRWGRGVITWRQSNSGNCPEILARHKSLASSQSA